MSPFGPGNTDETTTLFPVCDAVVLIVTAPFGPCLSVLTSFPSSVYDWSPPPPPPPMRPPPPPPPAASAGGALRSVWVDTLNDVPAWVMVIVCDLIIAACWPRSDFVRSRFHLPLRSADFWANAAN